MNPMKLKKPSRLSRDISLILLIKCCLLWILWHYSFSNPVAQHMKVDDDRIQKQFLSPSPPSSYSL